MLFISITIVKNEKKIMWNNKIKVHKKKWQSCCEDKSKKLVYNMLIKVWNN